MFNHHYQKNRKLIFFLLMFLTFSLFAFAQNGDFVEGDEGMGLDEHDNIDAHYIHGIFYWPEGGSYLLLFYHTTYFGPTSRDDGTGKIVYYVKKLDRNGRISDIALDVVEEGRIVLPRPDDALQRLQPADFIDQDYVSGIGIIWNFGNNLSISEQDDPAIQYSYNGVIFIGYKGDLIGVLSEGPVNAMAGFVDLTKQKAFLYHPPLEYNFWELNREGFFAYQKKDYEKAIQYFKASLAINPDFIHANFNLACTYSLAGYEFEKGRQYLQRLLDNDEMRGYYVEKIETDTDLDNWRDDPDFISWFVKSVVPLFH